MNKEKKITDFTEEELSQMAIDLVPVLKIRNENTNLKQALNEIRKYAKRDWDLQSNTKDKLISARKVLQIIDKVLGGNEE